MQKINSILKGSLGLCLAFLLCWPSSGWSQGQAAAFEWGATIETNLRPDEFFDDNFTISIWFMQKYPGAYRGSMVAMDTDLDRKKFSFGQEGFHKSVEPCKENADGSTKRRGEASLYINMGLSKWLYPAPVLRTPGIWHHLAFVKIRNKFSFYLDGEALVNEEGKAEIIPGGMPPRDVFWLGNSPDEREQFYGLLDNFRIYKKGLSESEIKQLANRQIPPGLNNDLQFQTDFDTGLPMGWQKTPSCLLVPSVGHNVPDRAQMLPPNHVSTFYVPFPSDEIWKVFQGHENYGGTNGDCGSHYGNWSFSVDMMRVGKGFTKQSQSKGEAITACSPGIVDEVVNQNEDPGDPSNFLKVLSAPQEYISYMHFAKESNRLAVGDKVLPLDFIGTVSDIGAPVGAIHLHQSLTTASKKDDAVSRPFAWSEYEYSTNDGATWNYAKRRRPLPGDWVRNTVSRQRLTGKLSSLRVNDVGIQNGSGEDKIMAEVIVKLEGESKYRAYGFQLRTDDNEVTHQGMLEQLRTAFKLDRPVTLTFSKSAQASFKQVLVNVEMN